MSNSIQRSDVEKKVLDIFKDKEELDMVEINRRLPDTFFTDALSSLTEAGLIERVYRKK